VETICSVGPVTLNSSLSSLEISETVRNKELMKNFSPCAFLSDSISLAMVSRVHTFSAVQVPRAQQYNKLSNIKSVIVKSFRWSSFDHAWEIFGIILDPIQLLAQ